jgi:hypothetical protein
VGPKRGERGVQLAPGSLERDADTGDWAEWAVSFGFDGPTGVYPIEKLRIVESESAKDTD